MLLFCGEHDKRRFSSPLLFQTRLYSPRREACSPRPGSPPAREGSDSSAIRSTAAPVSPSPLRAPTSRLSTRSNPRGPKPFFYLQDLLRDLRDHRVLPRQFPLELLHLL